MKQKLNDNELCNVLINLLSKALPDLEIKSGADEPFYEAPIDGKKAVLYCRENYPRSITHELSHFCLAGNRRRQLDDFGFWYVPCGRTAEEQIQFEKVEARPQGLEKLMCELIGLKFSPSLDDFSGRPASPEFLENLEAAYQEMNTNPPPTAEKVLNALKNQRFTD